MERHIRSIRRRITEFEKLGKTGLTTFDFSPFLDLKIKANLKSELAFCLSTANSSAVSGLKFQKLIEDVNPDNLSTEEFEELLKSSGVRFHRKKAVFIRNALDNFDLIVEILEADVEMRNELVRNVKGLGLKEASHFLRNIGKKDVAIVDRHIARYLKESGHLSSKQLTPKKYLECEAVLKKIASKMKMSLAELDLFLWYKETGKILK
jgi:N-glycosylase/DNA lyase